MSMLRNPWFRWVFSLALLGVALFVFRDQLPFIASGFTHLQDLTLGGVVLASLSALGALFAMGEVMYLLLNATHVRIAHRQCHSLVFACNALSASLPGGPAFSTMMQFQVLTKWKASPAICAWFLVLSSSLSAMWLIALGLMAILFLGAHFSLVSLVVSYAIMVALTGLVYLGSIYPDQVKRIFSPLSRRFFPQINEHIDQLKTTRLKLSTFVLAACFSLLNWVLDIVTLYGAVWAVTHALPGVDPDNNHTTIAGIALAFVSAKIAGSVQVTPGGLGPVEAAMMGTLVATGMTATEAFSTVFIYRIISFFGITIIGWLVYLVGFSINTPVRYWLHSSRRHQPHAAGALSDTARQPDDAVLRDAGIPHYAHYPRPLPQRRPNPEPASGWPQQQTPEIPSNSGATPQPE